MVIKNVLGWLKGRFGCLWRTMDINFRKLQTLTVSNFILHNFCKIRNEKLLNARLQDHCAEENIAHLREKKYEL